VEAKASLCRRSGDASAPISNGDNALGNFFAEALLFHRSGGRDEARLLDDFRGWFLSFLNGPTREVGMIKPLPSPQRSMTLDDAPITRCGELSYRFGTCIISRLRPHPENPRTHDRAQRRKLKKLFENLGLGSPPVIDETEIILAGHARVEAAKELGMTEMPVIQIFGLSEAKKRAYLIADNRAALDAGWDRQRLTLMIPELTIMLVEEELTIDEATGFEVVEIDQLTADFASKPDPIDDVELPDRSSPVISALGDLFALGDHRLFVGDAREPENFRCLMGDERADVAILDAPYNRPSDQIGGRGRTKHDDFLMGSGEMSNAEFVKFLRQTHANVANFSRDGQSIILSWTGVVFAG